MAVQRIPSFGPRNRDIASSTSALIPVFNGLPNVTINHNSPTQTFTSSTNNASFGNAKWVYALVVHGSGAGVAAGSTGAGGVSNNNIPGAGGRGGGGVEFGVYPVTSTVTIGASAGLTTFGFPQYAYTFPAFLNGNGGAGGNNVGGGNGNSGAYTGGGGGQSARQLYTEDVYRGNGGAGGNSLLTGFSGAGSGAAGGLGSGGAGYLGNASGGAGGIGGGGNGGGNNSGGNGAVLVWY